MQALAKPEVGDFLSKNYVSVYDKVGTFQVNVAGDGKTPNKNGGNVAAFFCAPGGRVIHVAAGPRTAEAFLAEAKWAKNVYTQVLNDRSRGIGYVPADQGGRIAAGLRLAHSEALQQMRSSEPSVVAKVLGYEAASTEPKLRGLEAAGRGQRQHVHDMLRSHAFEPLPTIGPRVYTHVLGEMVTNEPVQLNGAVEARQGARTGQSLADFFAEGGPENIAPPKPDEPSKPPAKTAKPAQSRNSVKRW